MVYLFYPISKEDLRTLTQHLKYTKKWGRNGCSHSGSSSQEAFGGEGPEKTREAWGPILKVSEEARSQRHKAAAKKEEVNRSGSATGPGERCPRAATSTALTAPVPGPGAEPLPEPLSAQASGAHLLSARWPFQE